MSRQYDLCVVCFRSTAGGITRWSWLACADCRAINDDFGNKLGHSPFPLGRHSIMNGVGVRGSASPEVRKEQADQLVKFARGNPRLNDWRTEEYERLAAAFEADADVPLREWQQRWPPSRDASQDAFRRLLEAPRHPGP
ncbi:MAG: hypothetical protein WBB07_27085 [Mycobacterium sp.]